MLATTDDAQTLVAQTLIDQEAISESDSTPVPVLINVENPNLESCKSQSFTEEELQQNVRKAIA
ncbi:hypothetical protein KKG31_01010 [Patescibacteria group bacterium]|nr:hypothetical protein [Patescibacteria group bacterium]MBU1757760.1 hypothetical protein [Patescibacteria group bacterium]